MEELLLIALALCLVFALAAVSDSEAAPLYGRWGRTFAAQDGTPHHAEVTVRLTSPKEKNHTVSGYWDGGTSWGVRFMPDEEGEWSYRSESDSPGLDGVTGTFSCRRVPTDDRFLQHGPLRVSRDGRSFEHADGTPFFWLGDTVWTGPQLAAKGDWDRFLDDRVQKKFTGIQFVLTAPWRTAPTDENGHPSYTGQEEMRIVPEYFRRMDERVNAINAHGLLAIPVMLWSIGPNDPGRFLPEDQAIRLARYLLARYGAHHVAWILPGDDKYVDENAEKWKRIGRAVFDGREHAPVTLHPQGMQWPFDGFKNESWIGYYGYQSGHGDDARTVSWLHSGPPAQAWKEGPARPVINLEPPYEDHFGYQSKQPHSAYNIRRAAYWSLLNAPTAGLTYGAHGVWSWHSKPGEPPTDHPYTGVAKPWHEAMDLPGSRDMKVMAEFFTSLSWWKLRPRQDLLSRQPGEDDPFRHIAASQSEDAKVSVFYLPTGGELSLKASLLPKRVNAAWFDPRTGVRSPASPESDGSYTAPDDRDWVLLIQE
ncbi:MAG: DUF4038 domain-containing protein [Armatimonadetes bacterium]|nr:DUF4038 domain-containing protein [Armatimonadota bacterium]